MSAAIVDRDFQPRLMTDIAHNAEISDFAWIDDIFDIAENADIAKILVFADKFVKFAKTDDLPRLSRLARLPRTPIRPNLLLFPRYLLMPSLDRYIAGLECRCCWNWRGCRFYQDFRESRVCRYCQTRLPAETVHRVFQPRLLADIADNAEIADFASIDVIASQYCQPSLSAEIVDRDFQPGLLAGIVDIAEIGDFAKVDNSTEIVDFATLPKLPSLPRRARLARLARLPRLPRTSILPNHPTLPKNLRLTRLDRLTTLRA